MNNTFHVNNHVYTNVLQNLDADQWCQAMKAAGMKMDGNGDVMKALSQSCQKYELQHRVKGTLGKISKGNIYVLRP